MGLREEATGVSAAGASDDDGGGRCSVVFQAQSCFARREKRERERERGEWESGSVGALLEWSRLHAGCLPGYFASYFQRRIGPEKMTRTMASVSCLLIRKNLVFDFYFINFYPPFFFRPSYLHRSKWIVNVLGQHGRTERGR